MKDSKILELKEKFKNANNSPGSSISTKNPLDKINEGFFSPYNLVISSKNATKVNSIHNTKNAKKMSEKKNNVYKNENERKDNNSRSHSLNKIGSKNNYTKEMKSFVNYLKNNNISGSGRDKSHRNFMINNNRCENNKLGNINKNRKKEINSKKVNYSNLIYMKNKTKDKLLKNIQK